MKLTDVPVGVVTAVYVASYVPYMMFTRLLATIDVPGLGRPLTAFETLLPVVVVGALLLFLFFWRSGWLKAANSIQLFGMRVPFPRRATAISGIGMGLLLVTVQLSLTFHDVSIPFMQLVLRGDVLILAPAIDLVFGRKVRWYSWLALAIVGCALALTTWGRGGIHMPPLAIATVVLYVLGFCLRLVVMTKIAKTSDPEQSKAYFVEENIGALPISTVLLLVIGLSPFAAHTGAAIDLHAILTWKTLWPLLALSVCWFVLAIVSALILLGPRENTFCVPLDRSASIISGSVAAFGLGLVFGQPYPTLMEDIGTVLLIIAIVVLSVGPRISARSQAAPLVRPENA